MQGQNTSFSDGFEDGNFTHNPAWTGDTTSFKVVTRNKNHLLKLNAPAANQTSYLSTKRRFPVNSWIFYLELQFSPSSSNRCEIFLSSDTPDLDKNPSGYAIRTGSDGRADHFELVRYDDGVIGNTIISDTLSTADGGGFTLEISRDNKGGWYMNSAKGYREYLERTPLSDTDSTYNFYGHVGVRTYFTQTRSDKFLFDFSIDPEPLTLTQIKRINPSQLGLRFSSPLFTDSLTAEDFSITDIGSPLKVNAITPDSLHLLFKHPLSSGSHTLTIQSDIRGKESGYLKRSSYPFTVFDDFKKGDVAINEILFDPPGDIPEYIELINISPRHLNLKKWTYADAQRTTSLTNKDFLLKPGDYLVITPAIDKLKEEFGNQNFLQLNSWPSLNNGGDLVVLSNSTNTVSDSLHYQSHWTSGKKAMERRSPYVHTQIKSNWGMSNNSIGTPGFENSIPKDTIPPSLEVISVSDSTILSLFFSESISFHETGDSLFSLNDTKSPINISITDSAYIHLDFNTFFRHGAMNKLSLPPIQDHFGNTLHAFDTSFTYYRSKQADSGSVLISEFMYDPPADGLEYIELYNNSAYAIDLSTIRLKDANDPPVPVSLKQALLPPGEYAVTANSDHPLFHKTNVILELGNRFPTLNNSGDAITLSTDQGMVSDSLFYIPEWGGRKRALERRSYKTPGIYFNNWSENTLEQRGTPGYRNKAQADRNPPVFKRIDLFNNKTFQIIFDEFLDESTADNPQHYSINPDMAISSLNTSDSIVTFYLKESLTAGNTYSLRISEISDIFGNTMEDITVAFKYTDVYIPNRKDVVINEFFPSNAHEQIPFIELYNKSEKTFDITEWKLSDRQKEIALKPAINYNNQYIHPGEYILLTPQPDDTNSLHKSVILNTFPHLNRRKDQIKLSAERELLDVLNYNFKKWNIDKISKSIERLDPLAATNDPGKWKLSCSPIGHSKGKINACHQPDTTKPFPVFATPVRKNKLKVHFNEYIHLTPDTRFFLGENELNIQSDSQKLSDTITLIAEVSLSPRDPNKVFMRNIRDASDNKNPTASIPLAYPPVGGTLLINEVMFNPMDNLYDSKPNQSEYLEIFNTANTAISLEGLLLKGTTDERGSYPLRISKNSRNQWIEPGGYAVVHPDTSKEFSSSRLAKFFNLDSSVPNLRIPSTTLGLNNQSDSLYLLDSTFAVIDELFYRADWHLSDLSATKGISLEKISPNISGGKPHNWSSSADPRGGTPGHPNSVSNTSTPGQEDTMVSLTPNPFSPDGDGRDDHLAITYRSAVSDSKIRVRIFNRNGQLVRTLTEDNIGGHTGRLHWNGYTDAHLPNRVGIYIILFEIYNETGIHYSTRKTVVLARSL